MSRAEKAGGTLFSIWAKPRNVTIFWSDGNIHHHALGFAWMVMFVVGYTDISSVPIQSNYDDNDDTTRMAKMVMIVLPTVVV